MTAAARAHAVDRGIDYRGLPLFAFGGAGPVHACYVAELLDSPVVIYPPLAERLVRLRYAGHAAAARSQPRRAGAAVGDSTGSARTRFSASLWMTPTMVCAAPAARRRKFRSGLVPTCAISASRTRSPRGSISTRGKSTTRRGCAKCSNRRMSGFTACGCPRSISRSSAGAWSRPGRGRTRGGAVAQRRRRQTRRHGRARFGGNDVDAPVYTRSDLACDQVVAGPAIIEERETTIIILPGWRAKVDRTGCIMASKE